MPIRILWRENNQYRRASVVDIPRAALDWILMCFRILFEYTQSLTL
jgi:hypothetical protein